MGEPWGHCGECNKPDTQGKILYDPTHMSSLGSSDSQRQRVGWWGPGAAGRESLFDGDGVSMGEDEKSWETDAAEAAQQWECTWHVWTVHLKMAEMVNLLLSVFYHN